MLCQNSTCALRLKTVGDPCQRPTRFPAKWQLGNGQWKPSLFPQAITSWHSTYNLEFHHHLSSLVTLWRFLGCNLFKLPSLDTMTGAWNGNSGRLGNTFCLYQASMLGWKYLDQNIMHVGCNPEHTCFTVYMPRITLLVGEHALLK